MTESMQPQRGTTDNDDTAVSTAKDKPRRGKKPRKLWPLVLIGTLIVALLAGIIFAAAYYFKLSHAMDNVNRAGDLLPSSNRPASPHASGDKNAPLTFLLLGSDSRNLNTDRGRSDVTMLIQLSGDRKNVSLISIPRDSWVDIPGHGKAKINAAYAHGGPALAVQTVEQLFDVRIDHVAITNFELFIGIIDSLGGVEINNKNAGQIDGHVFPVGKIKLNGEAALKYCRERYDLPNGDLDRAARQRAVMMAIVNKLISKETLTNPSQLANAINQIAPYFTVDEQLTNQEMQKIGTSVALTGGKPDMHALQAPLLSFGRSADGQSIDLMDENGVAELSTALKNDAMAEYYDKHKNDPPLKNG